MATRDIIDAKLRIAAEVGQAIKDLRALKAELLSTGKAADGAGGSGAGAKSDTDQVVSQVKRRSQAERDAAAEAKRLAKDKLDADKAAAKERQRIADDEARRNKQADDAEAKRQKAKADAQAKAARGKAAQGAQLAPQLNDIFVGLTTGQNPLQVALQQAPQITQIYGGVGNTFKAVLAVLTPLRVALGAVAGGFLLVATQIAAGYRESSQLNKQLALSGNIAGTSLGQINSLALDISNKTGQSIGFVRDALAAVLSISGQTDTTLGSTTRAVSALAKLTGQSAEEAVKGFADQADGITQWATKSNKAYNFLTAEQVRYIRTLEQQGRIAEAIKFTNDELAKSLEQRGVQAIGSIERAWNAATGALSKFLDTLKSIGRDDTIEQRLQRLNDQLAGKTGRRSGLGGAETQRIKDEIAGLNRAALNNSETAAAGRAEQDQIQKDSREFQASLAALSAAGAQKALAARQAELDRRNDLNRQELANRVAALDAEQTAVKAAAAQELISASDLALKLGKLDEDRAVAQLTAAKEEDRINQERARAQLALAERELAIERQRGGLDKPEEKRAQQAAIAGLEARVIEAQSKVATAAADGERQLIEARGRVNAALGETSRLVDAEVARLQDSARKRLDANALDTIPRTVADPGERARQTAEAATSQARKEVADLQRDLNSLQETAARVPGAALLVPKLEAELAAAKQGLAELQRKSELDSLFAQAQEQIQQLQNAERELDRQVEQGALTTEEAERKKIDARKAQLPVLQEILRLERERAKGPAETNQVDGEEARIRGIQDALKSLEKQARDGGINGLRQLFNDIATGAKSGKDALVDMIKSFGLAILDLINKRLAEKLFQQFEALGNNGDGKGGWFAAIVKAFAGSATGSGSTTASVNHSGGVIGGSISRVGRAVSPLVFAGAQVLHSGGIAGLASGEVPAILQAGEEVLTSDDPRHARNLGRGPAIGNVNISVNVTTDGSTADPGGRAKELADGMKAVVQQYVTDQMRQGGVFARK